MAYYGRPPSELEVDSHYALFTMALEDGLKTKRPVIDVLKSVDADLRELYKKNKFIAGEVGARMNMSYSKAFYPFRFRTRPTFP